MLIVGCGDPSCDMRRVVDRFTDASMRDCGDLPLWTTPGGVVEPAYRAGNDCVAQSIQAQQPFVVQWDVPSIDSNSSAAYLGASVDGRYTVTFFEAAGLGRQTTGRSSCSALEPTATCDLNQLLGSLCFECVGPIQLDVCRAD